MSNLRVYYGCEQLGFAIDGSNTYVAAHGVQSCGITTTFNLTQVSELGQIGIYENIEGVPDVEITAEKVLDGYPLLYHLATNGSTAPGLVGRANTKTSAALAIFPDTQNSASGRPIAEVIMSGVVPGSIGYNFGVDGPFTESFTGQCNSKLWRDTTNTGITPYFSGQFTNNLDQPAALSGYPNGVQQRWNLLYAPISGSPTTLDENSMSNAWATILPTDIYGISSSGTNAPLNGGWTVHVQSIGVSADLGRTPVYELGKKSYYARFISTKIEVRTEIEINAIGSDNISGTEAGGNNGAPVGRNLLNQTIRVQTQEGTRIDLGTRNKLTSVGWNGGDAGSGDGVVTNRYSYLNYNVLNVYHPADPSALSG